MGARRQADEFFLALRIAHPLDSKFRTMAAALRGGGFCETVAQGLEAALVWQLLELFGREGKIHRYFFRISKELR